MAPLGTALKPHAWFMENRRLMRSVDKAMISKRLVSVIVIFFNAEEFIQEAIESVLAQTYEHWELLLVDDGSTDTSRDIAARCTKRCTERVRYLEHAGHENRGM